MEDQPAIDTQQVREGLISLVRIALSAATALEEVVECAEAAAALGDAGLAREVAGRVALELDKVMASSGAWEAELTYSKIDAWAQTGHRARALSQAWGLVAPLLD